jgi:hypothetical protein
LERIENALQTLPEPFTVTSEEIAFGEDEYWGAENAQEQLAKPSTVGSVPLAEPSTVTVVTQVEPSIVAIVLEARYYSFPRFVLL